MDDLFETLARLTKPAHVSDEEFKNLVKERDNTNMQQQPRDPVDGWQPPENDD